MTASGPAHANGKKPKGPGKGKGKGKSHKGKNDNSNKREITCFNCQNKGHTQNECKKNMDKCKLCGGKGHMFNDCTLYRPPRSSALSSATVRGSSTPVLVSCTRLGSVPLFNILLDTGAEFSAISKRLVDRFHIVPTPVPSNEDQVVAGAEYENKKDWNSYTPNHCHLSIRRP